MKIITGKELVEKVETEIKKEYPKALFSQRKILQEIKLREYLDGKILVVEAELREMIEPVKEGYSKPYVPLTVEGLIRVMLEE